MSYRVLMLLENGTYPEDRRVFKEATTLVANGYEVGVICPRGEGQGWRQTIQGVKVYRFPSLFAKDSRPSSFLLEYAWSMLCFALLTSFICLQRGFDALHLHNPPDTLFLITLPFKLFGKQVVYDQHDLVPELIEVKFGSRSLRAVWLAIEGLSCHCANAVIASSDFARTLLIDRQRLSKERVTLVGNGPSAESLLSLNLDLVSARRLGPVRFGYLGIVDPQDGVEHLVWILHRLKTLDPDLDFSCRIIGDGGALESVKLQAKELMLDGHFEFCGFMDWPKAMKALSECDICLDPAPLNAFHRYNEGVKVLEYMAQAKPMVLSDLPGHRATAGETAVYADPEENEDFALKLRELVHDPARAQCLGASARTRFETSLSWEAMSLNLIRIYDRFATEDK